MKRKLTVTSLAGSNLRKRKKQYAIMIIGILLAMVFSSGILFFTSSLVTSQIAQAKENYGLQNGIITNTSEELFAEAKEEGVVTDYGFAHILGAVSTQDINSHSFIGYYDDKAMELSNISFIEGAYPQSENEIALEKSAFLRLCPNAKIGDKITLQLYPQNGYDIADNFVQKKYTLVGIAKDKCRNLVKHYGNADKMPIPCAFVFQGAQAEIGGKEIINAYYTNDYFKGTSRAYQFFYEREAIYTNGHDWINENYRSEYFYSSELEGTATSVYLAAFLIVILLIISCLGIINAFSNNLNERKKQIGMLKTLGATKRQIINIYGREAFFITLICVPFSLLISFFASKLIIHIINPELIFVPNVLVLLLCGIFGVFCVMTAALIPLIKASKISPIQSIRNIEMSRKAKKRKIKSQKLFSVPRLLAKRNLSFYKGRQTAVCIILIATVIFSCYGFGIIKDLQNQTFSVSYDYNISHFGSNNIYGIANLKSKFGGYTENDRNELLSSPYVQSVSGVKHCLGIIEFDEYTDYLRIANMGSYAYNENENNATPETVDEICFSKFSDYYLENKKYYSLEREYAPVTIAGFDEGDIKSLGGALYDGKIDIEGLNSGKEIILYVPRYIGIGIDKKYGGIFTSRNSDLKEFNNREYLKIAENNFKVGDEIDLSVLVGDKFDGDESFPKSWEKNNYKVKIGAIIYDLPRSFSNSFTTIYFGQDLSFLTTKTAIAQFNPNSLYNELNIYLENKADEETNEIMMSTLNTMAAKNSDNYIFSNFESAQKEKQEIMTLYIGMISIIIMFLSISGAIINNSLTAQIRDGKRKIGTLRAVGASHRDMVKSYIHQLLTIFGFGYGIGFGGYALSYLIIHLISTRVKDMSFTIEFSIWQTLLAAAVLFAICSINLWIKIKQETKNSIIDNIREL